MDYFVMLLIPIMMFSRWALKQESFSKPGQWKHSEVTNREWNKRAYSWPVKEDGNYNDVS